MTNKDLLSRTEKNIVKYIAKYINNCNILSISAIGSYTLSRRVLDGSDIDLIVSVDDIKNISIEFGNLSYKQPVRIIDIQGERIEFNVKYQNIVLDITILGTEPPTPNNPVHDCYENFLGLISKSICLYGENLKTIYDFNNLSNQYEKIRSYRLKEVENKITLTKTKIINSKRLDLYTIFEFQKQLFVREVISRSIFNHLSVKRADMIIDGFSDIFNDELKKCGIKLTIGRISRID